MRTPCAPYRTMVSVARSACRVNSVFHHALSGLIERSLPPSDPGKDCDGREPSRGGGFSVRAVIRPMGSSSEGTDRVCVGDTCYFERGLGTFDECAARCSSGDGAMACPSTQPVVEHIVVQHRDRALPVASTMSEPHWSAWVRNSCPPRSFLDVRWLAADYVRPLGRASVLLEARGELARARCLCEDPPSTCIWSSNQTANLCPLDSNAGAAEDETVEGSSSSQRFAEAARPCACSGLLERHHVEPNGTQIAAAAHLLDNHLTGAEWFGVGTAVCLALFILLTACRMWRKHTVRAARRSTITFSQQLPVSRAFDPPSARSSAQPSSPSAAGKLRGWCGPLAATRHAVAPAPRHERRSERRHERYAEVLPPLSLEEFRLELRREWELDPERDASSTYDPVAQAGRGLGGLLSARDERSASARLALPKMELSRLSEAQRLPKMEGQGETSGPSYTERSDRTTERDGPGRLSDRDRLSSDRNRIDERQARELNFRRGDERHGAARGSPRTHEERIHLAHTAGRGVKAVHL